MRKTAVFSTLALGWAALAAAQGQVRFEPVQRGAVGLLGWYVPQRLALSAKAPATIKKAPALKSPLYGVVPIANAGKRVYHVVLDEPAGAPAVLYVDANGDGDLANDPAAEWRSRKDANGYLTWAGGATLSLAAGGATLDGYFAMYRFDKQDPTRAAYKDNLFYYADYAYKGRIALDAKDYAAMLVDTKAGGDFSGEGVALLVDRDANGAYDTRWEQLDPKAPFAIDGSSWELAGLAPLGGAFELRKSVAAVAELRPPPDHSVGKKATAFSAMDLDGQALRFPEDYAGKIVLLDFWATWCGPCMGEAPGLVAAYKKYNPKGFEVLGVSLDAEGQERQLRATLRDKGMSWRQVYDGKYWAAAVAKLYFIESIPAPFLVDGDTGLILAAGDELRGAALEATLEKSLAAKRRP